MVTLCCIEGCFRKSNTKYHQELEDMIEEADTYIRFYSIPADIINKYGREVISRVPQLPLVDYITCPVDLMKGNLEAR